jgi:hypothetical protein
MRSNMRSNMRLNISQSGQHWLQQPAPTSPSSCHRFQHASSPRLWRGVVGCVAHHRQRVQRPPCRACGRRDSAQLCCRRRSCAGLTRTHSHAQPSHAACDGAHNGRASHHHAGACLCASHTHHTTTPTTRIPPPPAHNMQGAYVDGGDVPFNEDDMEDIAGEGHLWLRAPRFTHHAHGAARVAAVGTACACGHGLRMWARPAHVGTACACGLQLRVGIAALCAWRACPAPPVAVRRHLTRAHPAAIWCARRGLQRRAGV